MLPNENLIPGINLTPYSIWLATVVVSGISLPSYLLKRYVSHESGILVSGIVGLVQQHGYHFRTGAKEP